MEPKVWGKKIKLENLYECRQVVKDVSISKKEHKIMYYNSLTISGEEQKKSLEKSGN